MPINNKILSSETVTLLPHAAWLGICLTLFLLSLIFGYVFNRTSSDKKISPVKTVFVFLVSTLKKPVILFLFGYAAYVASVGAVTYLPKISDHIQEIIINAGIFINKVAEFIAYFWSILNVLNKGQVQLQIWFIKNNKNVFRILLPMISKSIKAAVILLMLNLLIPALGFNPQVDEMLAKGAKVFLIGILAWVVVELINGIENLILNQYSAEHVNPLYNRKINTQVLLLKKVIFVIVGIVTVASTLMVFDSVKNLGAGLLTTAGVLSALGAFASQQSLGRIFAGLQIAFTQPLRIGDTVIIDSEQGQVEEITLSYIVVKLWDLRRMIVPSDYFTNHGLQNLSRTSTDLLGTVFFYVDYMLPLEPVRDYFNEVLKNSKLWDGKVNNLQVTDIKESSMELRALVSAKDASTLWDLRCEVREKIMGFIIQNYPQYLSKTRNINWKHDELETVK
jgi:small-conductance mechanosensitive channel